MHIDAARLMRRTITSGAQPPTTKPLKMPRAGLLRMLASAASMRTHAEAPSLSWEAFPAVTCEMREGAQGMGEDRGGRAEGEEGAERGKEKGSLNSCERALLLGCFSSIRFWRFFIFLLVSARRYRGVGVLLDHDGLEQGEALEGGLGVVAVVHGADGLDVPVVFSR